MSRTKVAVFSGVTLLIPVAMVALLELGLRAGNYGGDLSLFEAAPALDGRYLVPARNVGKRYFPGDENPPSPPTDAFRAVKPP